MNTGLLIIAAALWGAAAGSFLPRAAYRFSAPAGEPWHDSCPGGHALKGWLGRASCPECEGAAAEGPRGPKRPDTGRVRPPW